METQENVAQYRQLIQKADDVARLTTEPTKEKGEEFDALLPSYDEAVKAFQEQTSNDDSTPQPIYMLARSMSAALASLGDGVGLRRYQAIQGNHKILREKAHRAPDMHCLDEAICSIAKSLRLYPFATNGLFQALLSERDNMKKRPAHDPETLERFTCDLIETVPNLVSRDYHKNIPYVTQARREMKERADHNPKNVHRASAGMAKIFLRSNTIKIEDVDDFLQEIEKMSETDEKGTTPFAELTVSTASMLSKLPKRDDITPDRYYPLRQASSAITNEKLRQKLDETLKEIETKFPKVTKTPFLKRPEVEGVYGVELGTEYDRKKVRESTKSERDKDPSDVQLLSKRMSLKQKSSVISVSVPGADTTNSPKKYTEKTDSHKRVLEIDAQDKRYENSVIQEYAKEHGVDALRIEADDTNVFFSVQAKDTLQKAPLFIIKEKDHKEAYETLHGHFIEEALSHAEHLTIDNHSAHLVEEAKADIGTPKTAQRKNVSFLGQAR